MTATIHTLLPDLLEAIFRYIPPKPRLLTVSTVCKRWRTLVLRTINKLPCRGMSGDTHHFPFTSLTRLDLDKLFIDSEHPLPCPASVKDLRFYFQLNVINVPPLESLRLGTYHAEIIEKSRPSLRSLSFSFAPERITGRFPLLEALTIVGGPNSLCRDHASQLTRLSVLSGEPPSGPVAPPGLVFAHLVHFTVPASVLVANDIALENCPALRTLTLLNASAAHFLALRGRIANYELVVHLQAPDAEGKRLAPQVNQALASLPRLTGLHLHHGNDHNSLALKPTLTALSLPGPIASSALTHLTRLRLLNARLSAIDAPLPSVSQLVWVYLKPADLELAKLGHYFPRLLKLKLEVEYPSGREGRRRLCDMLRTLDASGVSVINLVLVLYAQSYKRRNFIGRLTAVCKNAHLSAEVDDQSSETEESSAADSEPEERGEKSAAQRTRPRRRSDSD